MRYLGSYKVQADAIAKARGGFCLSNDIQSVKSFVLWKCGVQEHPAWSAEFQLVRGFPSAAGTWCPACRRDKQRLSLEHVRRELEKRGIKLLSAEFRGVESPIQCECSRCGYLWQTKYRLIKKGHGCRECKNRKAADIRRFSYKYVAGFLKERGITLLSKNYINTSSPIECHCDSCGHIWQPRFGGIKAGFGCPRCGRKKAGEKVRYTFDFALRYLNSRGIDLLSHEYTGCRTKLHIRFRACGHDSHMSLLEIKRGKRCMKCVERAKISPDKYEELAYARGGRLIAMARAITLPSTWVCNRGHEFNRSYWALSRTQTFCTKCSEHLAERQCRAAAEQLFHVPFRKEKLKEVRGIGGGPLELDIYNSSLKLAIEHNGHQHYEPQNNWGGGSAFKRQLEHDRRRREYCRKMGITLVEIRELNDVTHISDIKTIFKDACLKGGVPLPADYDEIELNLSPATVKTVEEEIWQRVIKQAKRINYTVVSTGYPGVHGKLHLICDNSHLHTPTTVNFLNGHFCRKCWLNKIRVPVVMFPLTAGNHKQTTTGGRVFSSIEEAARTLHINPNHIRQVVKGKVLTCRGYGVSEITQNQAASFKMSLRKLRKFCAQRWPNSASFDPYAKMRLRLSRPVILSDGRRFNSASEAARNLGVGKAAVLRAIRMRGKCCGYTVSQMAK
jgi:hypothetical protein